jgi:tetratricopeptide (TPR) repeat protein
LGNRRLHVGCEFVTAVAVLLRELLREVNWLRYEDTQRRVDEERAKLLSLPEVTIRQEQAARGRSVISGSPQIAAVSLDALSAELDRREAQLERRSRGRLLDVLCRVLSTAEPFALLIDTYEAASHARDSEFAGWFCQEFVPAIERHVPAARLVLAGREDLPEGLPSTTIRQWDHVDSGNFLARRGLTDPELADAVFAHCQGHPLVTSLAVDVWESGLEVGKPLTVHQLRQGVNQRAAVEWLMRQLYDRLPDGLSDAVRVAVRLRTYQPELICHLLPDTAYFDAKAEARLATLSFSEHLPGVGYRAHDLVREVEDAWFRQRPSEYRRFHTGAADYCSKAGDLAGILYHGIAADEERYAGRWFEAIETRRVQYNHEEVEGLNGLLEAPERRMYLRPNTLGLLRLEQALLARSRVDKGPIEDRTSSDQLIQAEVLFRESHGLFHEARSLWGEATTLRELGELQLRTDKLGEAERSFMAALGLFKQLGDQLGEANTLQSLGELQERMECLGEAEQSYMRALELFKRTGDRFGEAATLQLLGTLQERTDRRKAERSLLAALDLFRQVGGRLGEANVLKKLGDLQRLTDGLAEAERSYAAALELYRQAESRLGEAYTLQALGSLQQRTNRLPEAERSYMAALELHKDSPDRLGQANTLSELGKLQHKTGRLREAERSYAAALELYRQAESQWGEANTLKELGYLQYHTGQLNEAERSYTGALELLKRVGDRLGEASTLLRLGDLHVSMERLGEAELAYMEALELDRQVESRLGEASVHLSLGELHSRRGENHGAEAEFAAALEMYEAINDYHSIAATLASRGRHRMRQRNPEGFKDCRRALRLATGNAYLFEQVLGITLGNTVQMLASGEGDDYLAMGLSELSDTGRISQSEEQDSKFQLALVGFIIVHQLVAIKETGLGTGERSRLEELASGFDELTEGLFGLTEITREILRQSDAKA